MVIYSKKYQSLDGEVGTHRVVGNLTRMDTSYDLIWRELASFLDGLV